MTSLFNHCLGENGRIIIQKVFVISMQVPLIAGDFEDLLQQTVHVVYDLPIVEVDDTVGVCGIVL